VIPLSEQGIGGKSLSLSSREHADSSVKNEKSRPYQGRNSLNAPRPVAFNDTDITDDAKPDSVSRSVREERRMSTQPKKDPGEDVAKGENLHVVIDADVNRRHGKASKKVMDSFRRLLELRERAIGLRLEVQESRSALSWEQRRIDAEDADLIQNLRSVFADEDPSDLRSLTSRFEDIQSARENLRPMVEDLDMLTDRLTKVEFEMGKIESYLYRRTISAQVNLSGDEEYTLVEDDAWQSESSLSTHSGPVESSSTVRNLLSLRGDVRALKERLGQLRAERAQLHEEKSVRARVGQHLDEDSEAFLLSFDAQQESLVKDIALAEAELAQMEDSVSDRDDSLSAGKPPDYTYFEESSVREWNERQPPGDTSVTFPGYAHRDDSSVVSALLSTEERPNVFPEDAIEGVDGIISPAGYINAWLLHRLRGSVPEILRLSAREEFENVRLSGRSLGNLVLEYWFKDASVPDYIQARKLAEYSLNPSVQATGGQLTQPTKAKSETFPETRISNLRRRHSGSYRVPEFRSWSPIELNLHARSRGL
jgi:hypothetical protein